MQEIFAEKLNKYFPLLLVIAIASNATGLFNDILEPDGALYANIAKTIITKNDWINLYVAGTDWLDKPHLPFWLAATSYKVFGINSFAYKLPSFFSFLLGVLYTYKFSDKLFSKELAQLATLIFATSLHVIFSNFDVRAEGYITGFIIAAMYHFYGAMQKPWLKHIAAAAFYAALAMMTKGIFVLVTIFSGFVIYWIATKQWKQFLQPKWYLLLILSLIFITPELFCLYHQFDLHPEKLVLNSVDRYNVSGIKFFFWDSQFGRFFNTGAIKGSGDIFFFVHTTLWAFLPWAFYLFPVAYYKLKNIKQYKPSASIIIYASAFSTFLMFSVSKFQLPHYIVIIFPLLSIIVAKYLLEINTTKALNIVGYIQNITFIVLISFIALIAVAFKLDNLIFTLVITTIATQVFFKIRNDKMLYSIVLKAICFSVLLALFLNIIFYPQLLKYQAGMMAGKWQQKHLAGKKVVMFKTDFYSFEFYGNAQLKTENTISEFIKTDSSILLFTPKSEIKNLNTDSFSTKVLQAFPHFHISELNARFFNYKTRSEALDTFLIVDVKKKY